MFKYKGYCFDSITFTLKNMLITVFTYVLYYSLQYMWIVNDPSGYIMCVVTWGKTWDLQLSHTCHMYILLKQHHSIISVFQSILGLLRLLYTYQCVYIQCMVSIFSAFVLGTANVSALEQYHSILSTAPTTFLNQPYTYASYHVNGNYLCNQPDYLTSLIRLMNVTILIHILLSF